MPTHNNTPPNALINILTGMIVSALFVVGAALLYYLNRTGWRHPGTGAVDLAAALGQFGDFMGGTVNPILAFFSLIALLFTVRLQSEQLQLSREELRLTRLELTRSAAAQEAAAAAANEQARHGMVAARITALAAANHAAIAEVEAIDRFWKGEVPHGPEAKQRSIDASVLKARLTARIMHLTNELLDEKSDARPDRPDPSTKPSQH